MPINMKQRVEQDKQISEQSALIDPNKAGEAVARGFASIERGDFIDIRGDAKLRQFFADIITRGKKRLAQTRP